MAAQAAEEGSEDEYMAGVHLSTGSTLFQSNQLVPYGAGDSQQAAPSAANLQLPLPRESSVGPSTPTSTSGRTSTSASSRNAPSEGANPHRRPRQNNRSREFQGVPRAPKKKKGPKRNQFSEANMQPLGGPSVQSYTSTQVRYDSTSSSARQGLSHQGGVASSYDFSLPPSESLVPISSQAPLLVGHALSARQSRELFRDTDTGTLHPMRVTETSFSSLGLAAELPHTVSPAHSAPPPIGHYAPAAANHPAYAYAAPSSAAWPSSTPAPISNPAIPSWNPADLPNAAAGWGSSDPDENAFPAQSAPSGPSFPPPPHSTPPPMRGYGPSRGYGPARRR
jgi:hypothetical protein